MLGIDVEVPKLEEEEEEEEREGEEGEGDGETQFHVELDGSVCPCTGVSTPNGVSHEQNNGCHDNGPQPQCSTGAVALSAVYSQQQLMGNQMADKLDVMMMVTLSHLHSLCHPKGN